MWVTTTIYITVINKKNITRLVPQRVGSVFSLM